MPEISHKTPNEAVVKAAQVLVSEGVKSSELEAEIMKVLQKRQQQKVEATKPKDPNWTELTEADAYRTDVYIPVYEHDIPDYMNMNLKDQEYICVWANKDQRRLGALLAEGYELLKQEHVHPEFRVPLVWSSEGTYEYADVICMRVHKRIILSKRRKAFELSMKQLSSMNKPPRTRFTPDSDFSLDSGLGYYDADSTGVVTQT